MDIITDAYQLRDLANINVVLGKNGCGKSTLLKSVEVMLASVPEFGNTKYITPERGGVLVSEPNIEQQYNNDRQSFASPRRANQHPQFRQQTMAQYRFLENRILRELEASIAAKNKRHPPLFIKILDMINSLLENIEIRRIDDAPSFKIYSKINGQPIDAAAISSGESELISLAIECLAFSRDLEKNKRNILFIDEPDVHLHPDLQARLVKFLVELAEKYMFEVIIATHSTAILGELGNYDLARVALMVPKQTELTFEKIDEQYKKILPVFGAHPLSNVFNKSPLLLVEGDDDERIWQQAVRSSNGKINVYPVACGSVDEIHEYEKRVKGIVTSVYDKAKAYSLRDRDDGDEEIRNFGPIVRMKLSCRTAENLLLSDDVITYCGSSWSAVKTDISKWLENNTAHAKYDEMKAFKEGGFKRKEAKLKEVRLLVVADILASNKPWEVLVGQVLAQQIRQAAPSRDSIQDYLGLKTATNLLPAK